MSIVRVKTFAYFIRATFAEKWRKSIPWVFMRFRTASRKTDFTFPRNKAHNARCTISRRYLRIVVFGDIKFSISLHGIFFSHTVLRISQDENKTARELHCKTFTIATRTSRIQVAAMVYETYLLYIFVCTAHFATCDIGLTTR